MSDEEEIPTDPWAAAVIAHVKLLERKGKSLSDLGNLMKHVYGDLSDLEGFNESNDKPPIRDIEVPNDECRKGS